MIQRLTDIKTDSNAAFEKASKQLLIAIDEDRILLALADKESKSWNAAEILQFDMEEVKQEGFVKELQQKSSLANYAGLETKLFFATPRAMLIPARLANNAELFVKTQFGLQNREGIYENKINDEINTGFILDEWQQKLAGIFPQAEVDSTLGLLVKQALAQKAKADFLLLNINGTLAELVLIKSDSLALARCFSFSANEDVLYHLLNACKQFEMSPANLIVSVQGYIKEDNALLGLIKNYFNTVQFTSATPAIEHKVFSQVPAHYLTALTFAL